jgi:hypothetical protein
MPINPYNLRRFLMKIINIPEVHKGSFILGAVTIVAKFDSRLPRVFYRVFLKPNGTYIAKTSMDCSFEFICSVNSADVKWL